METNCGISWHRWLRRTLVRLEHLSASRYTLHSLLNLEHRLQLDACSLMLVDSAAQECDATGDAISYVARQQKKKRLLT